MLKRISAFFLVLCLLSGTGILPARAESSDPAALLEGQTAGASELMRNSDAIAIEPNRCWYVDTMGEYHLLLERCRSAAVTCVGGEEAPVETVELTDYPVDQVLYWEGELLCSAGNRLLTLDAETGALRDSRSFEASVDRFARSPEGLYVLAGGKLLRLTGETEEAVLTEAGVTRFWLEDPTHLSYMTEETTIHNLNLATGAETLSPNRSSDLEDAAQSGGDETCATINDMRTKFPHGKYWNHMPQKGTGMTYNNQNGYTSIPCTKHNNYCGTSQQTCNGYAPNGREIAYQCWGYADKLGHDVSGSDPENYENNGWSKLWYRSSLNNLKAGDIIRFNKNGSTAYAHSLYVTGVSGDTITYSDCNYDGTCVIRWGQTISKSTIYDWFVFLMTAPSGTDSDTTWLFNVNARLDGESSVNTVGYATFDFYYKGNLYKSNATDFRGYLMANSSYEVRNVQPVEGVLFDLEASSVLSGTMTSDVELILVLDHYYLNSAGEKVKTKLTDLPKQNAWSYRPICWALENGLASGLSETIFGPGENCTRAQIMYLLWKAKGCPAPSISSLPFTDVKSSSYYYNAVLWAVGAGYTSGKTPTLFMPNDGCTRAEAVTFLWNLAGKPTPSSTSCSFEDVPSTAYYYQAVLWAVENGITSGTSATAFSPKKICTRAEILCFLYKVCAS